MNIQLVCAVEYITNLRWFLASLVCNAASTMKYNHSGILWQKTLSPSRSPRNEIIFPFRTNAQFCWEFRFNFWSRSNFYLRKIFFSFTEKFIVFSKTHGEAGSQHFFRINCNNHLKRKWREKFHSYKMGWWFSLFFFIYSSSSIIWPAIVLCTSFSIPILYLFLAKKPGPLGYSYSYIRTNHFNSLLRKKKGRKEYSIIKWLT